MTKTLVRQAGFGKSLAPDAIIHNFTKNIADLQPHNILLTVLNSRELWNSDYPHRIHRPFTEEELFTQDKIRVTSKEDLNGFVVNPRLKGMKIQVKV